MVYHFFENRVDKDQLTYKLAGQDLLFSKQSL